MHHKTLKAAVEKYLPVAKETDEVPVLIEAIQADEKGFSDEEVAEIMKAIDFEMNAPKEAKAPAKSASLNTLYEEWKVKAIVSKKRNRETDEMERYVTFEKDAQSAIRTTSITADKAEILNSQSENTLLRLYEVNS